MKQSQAIAALKGLGRTETDRDKDVTRKREQRSEAARITIPDVVDPQRRERCLLDAELFLKTYFARRYGRPFGKHHQQMIDAILSKAKHGGRQAIAAPRGVGKSELVKGLLVFLTLSGLVRFPLPIASTAKFAGNIYSDFRKKLATNDMLLQDFPEVCSPVRDLDGAPLRAHKQHVDGELTQIGWSANALSFPCVPGSSLGGVKMSYYGLDAAFRGVNIDGDRPDFVLIDDPETRESAKSLGQIADREAILDQDISGLAGEDEDIAIVVLTTLQNSYCLSARLTDRDATTGKPAYNGLRFAMIERWPDTVDDPTDETKLGLWSEYIAKRNSDQSSGDEHGLTAVQFYCDNRVTMDAGVEMLTDHFTPKMLDDGTQCTFSTLQVAFDKIADTSLAAYRTEYQNDPDQEEEIETMGLSPARVQSRLSGLSQGETESDAMVRTIGIDIGKYHSHWCDESWNMSAIGNVVNYGVAETHGLTTTSDPKAVEVAQLASLDSWADWVMETINPKFVLVDSGTFTHAVYEFCRRRGRPFYPAKGWDMARFRIPQRSETKVPFLESYASHLREEGVWLYNVNTEWWKKWLQQRLLTEPRDINGDRNGGSMCIFDHGGDPKRHLSFAHHICAEEEQLQPVADKHLRRVWVVKNRNNHWLDACALGAAAAGVLGVRVIPRQITIPKPAAKPAAVAMTTPYGKPFVARR